jgi:hypothetical protein
MPNCGKGRGTKGEASAIVSGMQEIIILIALTVDNVI